MKYTVLFKHTCPTTTWAVQPGQRVRGTSLDTLPVFGAHAGKGLDDRILMAVVEAPDPVAADARARKDACPGWGTIVYLVFEGDLRPVLCQRAHEVFVGDIMELA